MHHTTAAKEKSNILPEQDKSYIEWSLLCVTYIVSSKVHNNIFTPQTVKMKNEKWKMKNERWKMKNVKWKMQYDKKKMNK